MKNKKINITTLRLRIFLKFISAALFFVAAWIWVKIAFAFTVMACGFGTYYIFAMSNDIILFRKEYLSQFIQKKSSF